MNFKEDFPILKDGKIAYLDSGATTQKPTSVIENVDNYYKTFNANPHRGAYSISVKATEVYDNAHEKVAQFINAKDWQEIAFTKNATEALNVIAYSYGLNNLKPLTIPAYVYLWNVAPNGCFPHLLPIRWRIKKILKCSLPTIPKKAVSWNLTTCLPT